MVISRLAGYFDSIRYDALAASVNSRADRMASFSSISRRYLSLRLGDSSISLVLLLLIIVVLGISDTVPRWLDLMIDSSVATAIFICLGFVGYFLECRLRQGRKRAVVDLSTPTIPPSATR